MCAHTQCDSHEHAGWKVLKFTPTKLRNPSRANSVQIAELEFQNAGQSLSLRGCTATNPGGRCPGGERPEKAIDGRTSTKWLDFNKNTPLVVSCPSSVVIDKYRFVTANDVSMPPLNSSPKTVSMLRISSVCTGVGPRSNPVEA